MERIKITPEERRRVSIKNANDRPNARATYGEANMDSTGTKNIFDRPFELAADKHNALCDRVADGERKTEQRFTDMINSVAQFEVEEAKRAAAEQERINNESIRVGSELGRTEAEDKRSVAENARVNNENARIEAENARISKENARISNEEKRILNENARMQVTDTLMQALAHLITLQEQYIAKGETA